MGATQQKCPLRNQIYSYDKVVTGCLSLPKDLAEQLLYFFKGYLLIGPGKVYNYFVRGYHNQPKRNCP